VDGIRYRIANVSMVNETGIDILYSVARGEVGRRSVRMTADELLASAAQAAASGPDSQRRV
jgi:hypothetical protein